VTPKQPRLRTLLHLAWPATLSFLLNNTYRINDQYWIQALGTEAQAAIGAMMFVAIMTFALYCLSASGTLALVARYEGANLPEERDRVARHALLFAFLIGVTMMLVGPFLIEPITGLMNLSDGARAHAGDYLRGFFQLAPPMVMILALDHIFIGRGATIVPMLMQITAVALNFVLNPILIYGRTLQETIQVSGIQRFPGIDYAAELAVRWDLQPLGLEGASLATGMSRLLALTIGLCILRFGFGMPLWFKRLPNFKVIGQIARISRPVSWSISVYAGVYWVLYALVLSRLDESVQAGFGIGFQVFEGLAFPTYLGIAMAGSSLVGRALGARDPELAMGWVALSRRAGYASGLLFMLLFWLGAAPLAGVFAEDPDVLRQTIIYAHVLAFSQLFVAMETVNEKVLLGSGYTRPITVITLVGNTMRIPFAYLFAITMGGAGAGVYWAINISTYFKAFAYRRVVQQGAWLEHKLENLASLSDEPVPPLEA
jgi:putative MATE family efflux protein